MDTIDDELDARAEAADRAATDSEVRELQSKARIGVAIVQFLSGPAGDALIERSERDEREILEKLATADPDDAKAIRDLQTDLCRVRTWKVWLMELVNEGKQAHEQLGEMQQTQ